MLQLMVEALKEKKYSIEDNQNVSHTRFYHALYQDGAVFFISKQGDIYLFVDIFG